VRASVCGQSAKTPKAGVA